MDISLTNLSNQIADSVAAAARSVVQTRGIRRPASGLVYGNETVVTMVRALGREDQLRVRNDAGAEFEAELAGWDPATGLAALRVPGLNAPRIDDLAEPIRVGHLCFAVGRSWSNAVTASGGIISIIGGPLPTGRHRSIEQVIRTTAPMHDGFAGGALLDTAGHLIGMTTAAAIRGLGVVIPAGIVWKTAAGILEHGGLQRGYLGLAGQPVSLPDRQRGQHGRDQALLVVGMTADSPAEAAGLLVGDLLLDFDSKPIESPDDLLALLVGDRVGRDVPIRILRGGSVIQMTVRVGKRG